MTYRPARIMPERAERPMIGISASEVRDAETLRQIKEGEPPGREIALGIDYVAAIERAGGIPVVIPPVDAGLIAVLLERLEGLCLSGGPDLDPSAYGAESVDELGPTDLDLDRFELELAREAIRQDLPILAICRGMQVLNVGLGGSLIQHLPAVSDLQHRQDDPGTRPGHPIEIAPGTRLADLAGATEIEVNTFHHQAIDRAAAELEVAARAPDEIIEAVESPDRDFVVGVQWHAELAAPGGTESRLFGELVDAASAYGRRDGAEAAR